MGLSSYDIRSSTKTTTRAPLTGVVTRIDDAGIWVVPLGGDMRTPIGPCRGTSAVQDGDTCLIVWTQEQPWAYSTRLPGEGPVTIDRLPVADPGETSATEVVRADDPRLSDSRAPAGAAGGDLSGTYPNPTVPGLAAKQSTSAKGQPNGYAGLDGTGKVPAAQLPPYPAVPVTSVAGRTGAVVLAKADVGLGNVDNTSDVNKPVSTATQTALNGKQSTSAKGAANGYASLDGAGKVPVAQLPSAVMTYEGTWNAATNTPALANGTGDVGQVYRCSVAGTRDFGAGAITFSVGDYAIYNSSGVWEQSDTTDAVASVAGKTGVVTLTKADVGLGSVDNTADSAKVVASAAKLTTARTINGVPFDGTVDITVTDSTKAPKDSPALTGNPTAPTPPAGDSSKSIANTEFVQAAINAAVAAAKLAMYPVGATYITVTNTNPGTFLGGTWTAFGSGQTLVGVNTSDTDFSTPLKTGGEKTHTLSAAESGLPSLGGGLIYQQNSGSYYFNVGSDGDATHRANTVQGGTNASSAHNNMPPFVTVYFWRRTA